MPTDAARNDDVADLSAARRLMQTRREAPLLPSGGGGGNSEDMEARVAALENAFEKIDGKLDKLLDRSGAADTKLAVIETKLDAKATTSEVSGLAGRVNSLPTTWQLITLVFGIMGGAFLILRFGLPHP